MKQVKVNKDGWSRWETPIMKGYLMHCCDCGLVHEVEFQAGVQKEGKRNGWFEMEEIPNGRVSLRMRRIENENRK